MTKKPIRFVERNKDTAAFFSVLRQRVDAYFTENKLSKYNNRQMVVKTIVLLAGYILPFAAMLLIHPPFAVTLLIWSFMGVSLAGVGMSVMHDANHNAYSSSRKINLLLGHSLNLLGGSVANWKMQHNQLHHTYTNIATHDDDIQDKAILRFSPHTEVKWYHNLQFLYAIPFYAILTLYWAFIKDFVQFFKYKREGLNKNSESANRLFFLKLTADKLIYIFVFFILPIFICGFSFSGILAGFLLMHAIAGIILTVVFQLAHTVEGTSHPVADADNCIENNWAIHQLNTTVNFATGNKLLSWYIGGLNFQVEHHLFPAVCHVHYPALAPIVKATAEEFSLLYMENETLSMAIRSHVKMLRQLGRLPDINEAIV